MNISCRRAALGSALAVFLLFVLGAPRAAGQGAISTGVINGTVADPTGAIIAGADVSASNINTGAKLATKTNEGGLFSFPAVPVGAYKIAVTSAGFKSTEVTGVNASIGQTASINVKLEVGDATQQVTVTDSEEVLNTSDSHVSSTIDSNLVENLPSLRRNFTDFVLLTPNATTDGQFGDVTFAGAVGGAFSNYANSNASNGFAVDGANATSRYWGSQRGLTRIPYLFGAESIQEFQVSLNPYSPAYGGASTGFVNTVTKSGTNAFHGQAFYFNRNTGTGAIDAVSKSSGVAKALDVRQQFGAGTGGRIIRDKAFFYFDYEQQRRKDPITVLNAGQQAVNVTNFGLPAGTALPAPTGYPVPGANTTVPTLQQVSNAIFEIQNNLGIRQRRQDDLVFFGRGDYQLSDKDQLSLHYNYNTFNSPGGTITSNPVPATGIQSLSNNDVRDHSAVIHLVHSFSPSLVSDAHVSYVRDQQITIPAGLSPPGFSPSVKLTAPQTITIGNSAFSDLREYEWAFNDRINYTKGRHSLDFGADISRDSIVSYSLSGYNGTYTFSSPLNFALGQFVNYSQNSGTPVIRVTVPTYAFYAGDTFKVTSKLTLNYGFRYDWQVYPQPPLNPALPLTGQYNNDYNRWAPRFGFAYHVLPKTVIRGGGGMFRAFLTAQNYINATTSNGLASLRSNLTLNYNSALSPAAQAVVFPNTVAPSSSLFAASANVNVIDPGLRDPSTLQTSLQIEQQVSQSTTITLGSLWVHGTHLISSSYDDLNLQRPTGTTNYVVCPAGATTSPCGGGVAVALPNFDSGLLKEGAINPSFGQIKALISPGNNNYISGFFELRQRMRHGFSAISSYTFSKNIVSNGVDFNNQFDFSNTRALALIDQRHRVVVGAVWEPQTQFTNGVARHALSHWTFSTSTEYGSGRPYAGILLAGQGGKNLNDSAFNYSQGIASAGPTPTVGLNSYEGPWSGGVDLSIERAFSIGEFGKLMFRAQGFNIMNHPNYYVQSGNSGQGVNQSQYKALGSTCGDGKTANQTCYLVPNAAFGSFLVVGQNTGPRIFQFAMIYRF
jgi:hypothetical protein